MITKMMLVLIKKVFLNEIMSIKNNLIVKFYDDNEK